MHERSQRAMGIIKDTAGKKKGASSKAGPPVGAGIDGPVWQADACRRLAIKMGF